MIKQNYTFHIVVFIVHIQQDTESNQSSSVKQKSKETSSSENAEVSLQDEKQTSAASSVTEDELKTPPPLLQHPINVVLPSTMNSASGPQNGQTLPLLFNRGAQCWIPVSPQLATPLTTWCHDTQEHVSTPECYWIASFAPATKQRCRDPTVSPFRSTNETSTHNSVNFQKKRHIFHLFFHIQISKLFLFLSYPFS